MRSLPRRNLLVGGALGALGVAGALTGGYELVQADALPGRLSLDRMLGKCGGPPPVPAETADVREQTFTSKARGRDVRMVVISPRGVGRRLPVVILLHGLGGDARAALYDHLDRHLAHAVAQGTPPFALVGVDGGGTYWHRRRSGDDPQKMITDEVLPRLAKEGLRTDRFGVRGWSMGGYGALLLAQTLGHERVAAVVASSPAVFPSYANARGTNSFAYDDQADFAANDVMTGLDKLDRAATWVDCGRSDPFTGVTRAIRAKLGEPAGGLFEGCHDGAYWTRRAPGQLDFLGRHLV